MYRFNSWIVLGLLVVLAGCATPLAYYEQAIHGGVVISPDDYKVDSKNYPQYRIRHKRITPIKGSHVWMYPSDIWVVTHKIGQYYLIFSHTYNQRLCREDVWLLYRKRISEKKPCYYVYSAHLLIHPDGTVVDGGWVDIADPKQVFLKGDRMVNLHPGKPAASFWGPQPSFEIINKHHAGELLPRTRLIR